MLCVLGVCQKHFSFRGNSEGEMGKKSFGLRLLTPKLQSLDKNS